MTSSLKSIVHTLATLVSLWLPTIADHNQALNLTIGTILALGLNWVISHTIPTTTGASATQ